MTVNTTNKTRSIFRASDYLDTFKQIKDHPRQFPTTAWKLLDDLKLTQAVIPKSYHDSWTEDDDQDILEILFEIGKGNLSLGRLYEGHINALLLIEWYGNKSQKQKYFSEALKGKIFGVWNTEVPGDGLKLKSQNEIFYGVGAKTFCSGGLHVQRPIVTAHTKNGLQMLVLELDEHSNLVEDWSLWNPMGMRASVSCRIDFSGLKIAKPQLLGNLNDYYREPQFSFGAVRFAAVQLGGANRIFEVMVQHLKKNARLNDTYQRMRMGKAAILMETAQLWLTKAIEIQHGPPLKYPSDKKKNFGNMMRTLTLDLCNDMMAIAEKAVGVQGTMLNHDLEQPMRDLRVYLKQAGPDAALDNIGNYVATHSDDL